LSDDDIIQRARDFLAGREPPPWYWDLASELIKQYERAEALGAKLAEGGSDENG